MLEHSNMPKTKKQLREAAKIRKRKQREREAALGFTSKTVSIHDDDLEAFERFTATLKQVPKADRPQTGPSPKPQA